MQYPKLNDATISDLQSILRGCMLLVGIRAANLPSPEETAILLQMIFNKYGNLTIAEIPLAFEKAVAGELECEANCYENFSCEYFGKIMTAYKKWASRQWNENQMYAVKPQTTNLLSMAADWKELCEIYYQDYLKNNFRISIMPHELYDEFVRCEMMAADAYHSWMKDANKMLLIKLKTELSETFKGNEKQILSEQISTLKIWNRRGDDCKIENIELRLKLDGLAKKLAVQFLYKTAKEKGHKKLFEKV